MLWCNTAWLSIFWSCIVWTGSSDDVMDKCGVEEQKVSPQRSNTTVHVCWHRNTSLSMEDSLRATHNSLSGYLLRKFKNSNGWQKLWVVFTNFCLFFYKTFQVCWGLFFLECKRYVAYFVRNVLMLLKKVSLWNSQSHFNCTINVWYFLTSAW